MADNMRDLLDNLVGKRIYVSERKSGDLHIMRPTEDPPSMSVVRVGEDFFEVLYEREEGESFHIYYAIASVAEIDGRVFN